MKKCGKNNRIFAVIISFLMILTLLPAQTVSAGSEDNETKTVRVAYFRNPGFQDGASETEAKDGYSYEYLQKIAYTTGWHYEYVYGSWNELYDMLLRGEVDLMAGLSYTKERAEKILFPKDKMGTEKYYLYTGAENFENMADNPSALEGKRIGCVKNNLETNSLIEWLEKEGVTAEFLYYDDFVEVENAFAQGAVDCTLETDGVSVESGLLPAFGVGGSDYYLAVAKGREDLLKELNEVQAKILQDTPEIYSILQAKYFGRTAAEKTLSKTEWDWVSAHRSLTIGVIRDYAPFCFVDQKGVVSGIIVDIMHQWRRELALTEQLNVYFVAYDSYDRMLEGLKKGEVNAIFPEAGSVWHSEKNGLYETDDVIGVPVSLIFSGEYSGSKVNRIALSGHGPFQQIYVESFYPDSEVIEKKTAEECLEAVLSGEADSTIFTSYRADMLLADKKYSQLRSISLNSVYSYCFGVNKGETALLSLLNKGLKLLDKVSLSHSVLSYTNYRTEFTLGDYIRENSMMFLAAGAVIFALVILALAVYVKTIQKAHRRSTEYTKRLAETNAIIADAGLGIWHIFLHEGETPRMRANEKMLELLGLQGRNLSEAEVYEHWNSRIDADSRESVQKSVDEMLSGHFSENTYLWHHPEQGLLYVRCGGSAEHVENGTYELCGYHGDVTSIVLEDQKQKEELALARNNAEEARRAAESANNAKSVFLNNMSHDIRTPMNAILGFTKLMEKHRDDPESISDYLGKIEQSGEYLLSIINNVLDMARIDSGKVELHEEVVVVGEESRMTLSMFASEIERKHLHVISDGEVEHPYVFTDPVRERQIFANLISNAIKYTPDGGHISIITTELPCEKEGWVRHLVTITDDGIGMSKDFQKQLFDSFSRERTTTESKVIGTGLGMSIVKKLVDLMGHSIEVESEPGKGTTFRVYLNHRIAEMPETYREMQNPEQESAMDFTGKCILMAEDNDLNAEIATEILEDVGFRVERAGDGVQCVDMLIKAEPGHYDVILMDIQMPVLNGYGATEKIRSLGDPKKANIPIFAMTANAFDEDKQLAKDAGMNGHLAKPIDVRVMMEALAEVFHE